MSVVAVRSQGSGGFDTLALTHATLTQHRPSPVVAVWQRTWRADAGSERSRHPRHFPFEKISKEINVSDGGKIDIDRRTRPRQPIEPNAPFEVENSGQSTAGSRHEAIRQRVGHSASIGSLGRARLAPEQRTWNRIGIMRR